MAKITLDSAVSGYNATTIYNSNNVLLEEALNDKVLYRDNPAGEANQMEVSLDMNSNRVLNLPSPVSPTEPARWADIRDGISVVAEAIPDVTLNADKVLVSDGAGLVFKDHQYTVKLLHGICLDGTFGRFLQGHSNTPA